MVHAGCAEPHRPPFFQVLVDAGGLFLKYPAGPERVFMVVKAVDADFKPVIPQVLKQIPGNGVIPWNEIEGGPESQAHLHFSQPAAPVHTFRGLHVMGQDKGELFPLRPTGPSLGRFSGGRVDGPCVQVFVPFKEHHALSQIELPFPGDAGFDRVEEFVDHIQKDLRLCSGS